MVKTSVRYLVYAVLLVCGLSAAPNHSFAEGGPYQSSFLGTAAEGYDVVAYFTQGKAVEGNSDNSFEWQGVTWRFSSKANLNAFALNPEKFAPQYGGYCAYAVSQGYTASIDPQAWSIVDDRLYLNYSKSVQSTWSEDISGYIMAADNNWPRVKKEL